jgi:hypothetical protein
VLEYSAKALLMMPVLGTVKTIDDQRILEIEKKFFGTG